MNFTAISSPSCPETVMKLAKIAPRNKHIAKFFQTDTNRRHIFDGRYYIPTKLKAVPGNLIHRTAPTTKPPIVPRINSAALLARRNHNDDAYVDRCAPPGRNPGGGAKRKPD
jgi:hypothetical protein